MISQVDLEEEAGDDAKDGVVDDEHDDKGVGGHRGDRRAGEGAGQVATHLVDCPTQLICTWIFICCVP